MVTVRPRLGRDWAIRDSRVHTTGQHPNPAPLRENDMIGTTNISLVVPAFCPLCEVELVERDAISTATLEKHLIKVHRRVLLMRISRPQEDLHDGNSSL